MMDKHHTNRRNFLRMAGAGAASLSLAPQIFAAKQDRPNILLVIAEDCCPDYACYGTPLVKTPNIDKLASEGILFKNTFSNAPVCSAARSA